MNMDVRKVMYSTYYANPTENESGAFILLLFLLSVVATLESLSSAVCTYVHFGMAQHLCAQHQMTVVFIRFSVETFNTVYSLARVVYTSFAIHIRTCSFCRNKNTSQPKM